MRDLSDSGCSTEKSKTHSDTAKSPANTGKSRSLIFTEIFRTNLGYSGRDTVANNLGGSWSVDTYVVVAAGGKAIAIAAQSCAIVQHWDSPARIFPNSATA